MASLAEIRAKLQATQGNQSNGGSNGEPSVIYPHWNIADGNETTIRFLPDADTTNDFFWVEKQMIRLPFAGIKGEVDSRPVVVQVPCIEMYDAKAYCPILTEVRGWFKDKSLEEMGRKYWKKRTFLAQGFVVEDGLKEDNPPENKIRRFIISPQIFGLIKSALLDPELDELPTDYLRGLDFRICKTSKGGFADYSTSKWSRRERALNEEELQAIADHGLFNLADFLPKRPGEVELKVIKEMFEASVDGEAYDVERWGQYYRPNGIQAPTTESRVVAAPASPVAALVADPVVSAPLSAADDLPWETPAAASYAAPAVAPETSAEGSNRAQDILKMIRDRQTA
jgi:hypothetical protein